MQVGEIYENYKAPASVFGSLDPSEDRFLQAHCEIDEAEEQLKALRSAKESRAEEVAKFKNDPIGAALLTDPKDSTTLAPIVALKAFWEKRNAKLEEVQRRQTAKEIELMNLKEQLDEQATLNLNERRRLDERAADIDAKSKKLEDDRVEVETSLRQAIARPGGGQSSEDREHIDKLLSTLQEQRNDLTVRAKELDSEFEERVRLRVEETRREDKQRYEKEIDTKLQLKYAALKKRLKHFETDLKAWRDKLDTEANNVTADKAKLRKLGEREKRCEEREQQLANREKAYTEAEATIAAKLEKFNKAKAALQKEREKGADRLDKEEGMAQQIRELQEKYDASQATLSDVRKDVRRLRRVNKENVKRELWGVGYG